VQLLSIATLTEVCTYPDWGFSLLWLRFFYPEWGFSTLSAVFSYPDWGLSLTWLRFFYPDWGFSLLWLRVFYPEWGFSTLTAVFPYPDWGFSLPWLRFFHAFSSVVRQMPGYNSQRQDTACTLPNLLLCCSVYFLCVNVHCSAATKCQPILQLTIYHIIRHKQADNK